MTVAAEHAGFRKVHRAFSVVQDTPGPHGQSLPNRWQPASADTTTRHPTVKTTSHHPAAVPSVRSAVTRVAATVALFVLALSAAAPARAAVQFQVQKLGTLGGTLSEGYAINASGQVAGRAYLPSGVAHATRWTTGVAQDLGTFGGQFSNAYGINDSGQVAGGGGLVPVRQRAVPRCALERSGRSNVAGQCRRRQPPGDRHQRQRCCRWLPRWQQHRHGQVWADLVAQRRFHTS